MTFKEYIVSVETCIELDDSPFNEATLCNDQIGPDNYL